MEDVFWSRSSTLLKFAELAIVTCMPPNAGDERLQKVMTVYRELSEMVFPHKGADRKAREDKLMKLMSEPGFMEPFSVTAIDE